MTTSSNTPPERDYATLNRELDRVKAKVFIGTNAAFLAPLMCSLNFVWDEQIPTAATDGISLMWNPDFFLSIPFEVRVTVLLHELWHVALLHMLRRGERHPKIWNWAADVVINNLLDDEGHSFGGLNVWMDHAFDGDGTEVVYDALAARYLVDDDLNEDDTDDLPSDLDGDVSEPDEADEDSSQIEHEVVARVVSAANSARIAGEHLPEAVEQTLKQFLSPKLPWETILRNFFEELGGEDYSWARPNRRYSDVYLPSIQDDETGLNHILYFLDVSGSITDRDIIRFHSEFKYVKDYYKPEKMTMAQFDTRIRKVDVFEKDDPFEEIHVIGRGGTCLECVREFIIEQRPTAVVVFSDLECNPMEPLPGGMVIPIIWVALNNTSAKVKTGRITHLRD
jgi:predicted metal-dependent peptidase